uniref:Uncharacterized protein n=1 Tax=Anguilla anguilla TaxID=7936 RepID=A0A0E9REE2_ANGAN
MHTHSHTQSLICSLLCSQCLISVSDLIFFQHLLNTICFPESSARN